MECCLNFLNIKIIKFQEFLFSIFQVFFMFHAISNIKKINIGVEKKNSGSGGVGGIDNFFFYKNKKQFKSGKPSEKVSI